MHDLNTINRLNEEAFGKGIAHQRAAGRYVLAKYEGLHVVSYETFSTADDVIHAVNEQQQLGTSFRVFTPMTDAERVLHQGRDQSEDRTLGDYINCKTY